MRVAVTGSSGLVGSALLAHLAASGHDPIAVVRGPRDQAASLWNPDEQWVREGAFDTVDAVVHLAGEGIADRRWSDARKRELTESRIASTRLLVEHLRALPLPPRVLITASAVGYYGSRGDETLTEESDGGEGFLAELCAAWEAESRRAQAFGVRAVQIRTAGSVLDRAGGTLAKMMLPFKLGLGGRLASGRQWFTWITLEDEVRAIEHLLHAESVSGPVNLTAPEPVTNADFTRAFARQLGRPALLPVPAIALRLLFGQLADEAILASGRVVPERLIASGFEYAHRDLDAGLAAALGGG
jgi:uncharacterized protein (TIGR01777 family)